MTKTQALHAAKRIARKRSQIVYVVWSSEPDDPAGEHYHTATEYDLDTFFAGCDPIAAVEPDGCVDGAL